MLDAIKAMNYSKPLQLRKPYLRSGLPFFERHLSSGFITKQSVSAFFETLEEYSVDSDDL